MLRIPGERTRGGTEDRETGMLAFPELARPRQVRTQFRDFARDELGDVLTRWRAGCRESLRDRIARIKGYFGTPFACQRRHRAAQHTDAWRSARRDTVELLKR